MLSLLKSEPVAAQALVQAAVTLVTVFGLHLTVEQVGAINIFSAALLAFITRQAVSPVAKAAAGPAQ